MNCLFTVICNDLTDAETSSKHIALSNRILQKIDQEASRQKRARSEWIELHFEALFFKPAGLKKDRDKNRINSTSRM